MEAERNLISKLILFFVVAMLGFGAMSGISGLVAGINSQRCNPPRPGEIIVRSSGNVLCDHFYAQEVNPFQSQSWKTEQEGDYLEAVTRKINTETTISSVGAYATLVIVVLVGLAIIFGRGKKNG